MDALTCSVCGGKLVMQVGGLAKCEYCGLEYSTESLREKVMEIKGTVNVQGIASADNILQRAKAYHEAGDFDRAKEYYNRYLDLNPLDEEVQKTVYELEHPSPNRFICQVCGYIYEKPEPPHNCPVCNAPSEKFKGDFK